MKILAIGDVVGTEGCRYLREMLPNVKKKHDVDFVIANGENAAPGNGITPGSAKFLFESGIDVITGGNHTFRRREIQAYLREKPRLLRPANFPTANVPGSGVCAVETPKGRVVVVNLLGTVFMDSRPCPFHEMDKILAGLKPSDIVVVDLHAEATSEKRALGFYLDGRVAAVFGTHTHVPTADATVLPNGTGYLTDAGMTGVIHSCLGVVPKLVISRITTKMPTKFEHASGPCRMDCVLFDIDETTKKCNLALQFSV